MCEYRKIEKEHPAMATLKKGEGRTIKAGGAWIFDNEIDSIAGSFENGDIVLVRDFDGYPMGKGFINQNSTSLWESLFICKRHISTTPTRPPSIVPIMKNKSSFILKNSFLFLWGIRGSP